MEEQVTNPEVQASFFTLLAKFMEDGGIFMWIILLLFCAGVAVAVERLLKYRNYDLDAESFMDNIKKSVINNNVRFAIELCTNSKALLSNVVKMGLLRANHDKEEIRDAVEAGALEVAPQIEKRLGFINLCANISTLLGLLGTIYGLIQSFAAVAAADPSQKSELLAMGISKAMNTTAFGLISAITLMAIHSFITSRADKMYSDIEQYSAKTIDFLGTTKKHKDTVEKSAA